MHTFAQAHKLMIAYNAYSARSHSKKTKKIMPSATADKTLVTNGPPTEFKCGCETKRKIKRSQPGSNKRKQKKQQKVVRADWGLIERSQVVKVLWLMVLEAE